VSGPATLRRERTLLGGLTNAGLVSRVGNTVRRPNRPTGESTRALLDHLQETGFDGAPRYLGTDEHGREVLTYIPGRAPIVPTPDWALRDGALVSVAELLRRYHDAAQGFDASRHAWSHSVPARFRDGLVTHNDPNLDNIIFREGRAVALIDFDLASPGSRTWDLACAARLWVPLRERPDAPPELQDRLFERLAMFADAYGATPEQRAGLVDAVAECHRWCYSIVQQAVSDGHKTFTREWRGGGRLKAQRTGQWLREHGAEMRRTLGAA
jgi:hypothetical protein